MKKSTKTSSKKRIQNKQGLSFVKSIKDLKNLINDGYHEYIIVLANGSAFSRKSIALDKKKKTFFIYNSIDDTNQKLTEKQLIAGKLSNIVIAIKRKAFAVNLKENTKII